MEQVDCFGDDEVAEDDAENGAIAGVTSLAGTGGPMQYPVDRDV
jgi:hypothetical protein